MRPVPIKRQIEHLKNICKSATPGPWVGHANADFGVQFPCLIKIRGKEGDFFKEKDALFISTFNPEIVSRLITVAEAALALKVGVVEEHPELAPLKDALEALKENTRG